MWPNARGTLHNTSPIIARHTTVIGRQDWKWLWDTSSDPFISYSGEVTFDDTVATHAMRRSCETGKIYGAVAAALYTFWCVFKAVSIIYVTSDAIFCFHSCSSKLVPATTLTLQVFGYQHTCPIHCTCFLVYNLLFHTVIMSLYKNIWSKLDLSIGCCNGKIILPCL